MDVEKLKSIFGGKEYDVNVITSIDGEEINGQAATWVTQASLDPPLMAVCISPDRYTNQFINASSILAINILAREQARLVPHFGYRSGRDFNKFAEVPHRRGITGAPILEGVAAYLDCKVQEAVTAGDHIIYIAEIVDAGIDENKTRLTYQWFLSQTTAA